MITLSDHIRSELAVRRAAYEKTLGVCHWDARIERAVLLGEMNGLTLALNYIERMPSDDPT